MTKSFMKGISLSGIILFSIILILNPLNGYANEIDVKSEGIKETSIITLTNDSTQNIKTFKIWLSENFNFKSFKTEMGWIGEKNPQEVIIFTSSEVIKNGESVKFGIKTDKINPIINWKVLNQNNEIIETGVIITSILSKVIKNPEIKIGQEYKNTGESIFTDSSFRIIPDKPNAGSTIRITGDQFGAFQKFELYVNTEKIGEIITEENGYFMTTANIPNLDEKERVEFKILSYDGIEKIISLRLGEGVNRVSNQEEVKLTIRGVPNILQRGEILEVYGKGTPGTAITVQILNSEQELLNTRTTKIDNTANWKLSEGIAIPFDADFGIYSIIISDGENQILKNWEVKTNKIIQIYPTKLIFDAGELIKFTGTALPNTQLELSLEDNLGNEMISDIINVDETGIVEFEYQTTENDDKEGTWTLIAIQQKNKEFVYVGYNEEMVIPINIEFNKSNYKSSEIAVITIMGNPLDSLRMLIIDPSGNIEGEEILIKIKQNGQMQYNLELTEFTTGMYSAVIQKGNNQNSELFSVGLQTGSGIINAESTEQDYNQGESMLILGNTKPNSLMTAELWDPNEKKYKTLTIVSDSVGTFTESKFRIPSDGISGIWKIKIDNGANVKVIEINVYSISDDGMFMKIIEDVDIPGFGKNIRIDIVTSHKTSVSIEIVDENGKIIDDTLNCNTTSEFKCELLWTITKDILPGTYTVKAVDSIYSTQATFVVK